jgi:D-alanine-D-alanine ligase-like ATP-grasp enzyme
VIVRELLELCRAGELPNIRRIDLEPEYGYACRLEYADGAVRMLRGAMLDINAHGAAEVAKDKGYTKFFLSQLGYRTPAGKVFLMPAYVAVIDRHLGKFGFSRYAHAEQICAYVAAEIGYPCYLKPHNSSQGRGVSRCTSDQEVAEVLAQFQSDGVLALIVEEEIRLPDYRVVVYRDKVVACYLRTPLVIAGNGRDTLRQLLRRAVHEFLSRGRDTRIQPDDPRIEREAARQGYSLESVLPSGQPFQVFSASNLSLGGSSEDWTDRLHPRWAELCCKIARDMHLTICGVDLACADAGDPEADYSILELNAAPGMDHFATLGPKQAAVVRGLYRQIFEAAGT